MADANESCRRFLQRRAASAAFAPSDFSDRSIYTYATMERMADNADIDLVRSHAKRATRRSNH